MNRLIKYIYLLPVLLWCSVSVAQSHKLTYKKKTRAVGSSVNINGVQHVMVKLPVREFATGKKFALTYAAPTIGGTFLSANVTTRHSKEKILKNAKIGGYPAHIEMQDRMTYQLSETEIPGQYNFTVESNVSIDVTIDIGATIINLTLSLEATNPGTSSAPLQQKIITSTNAVPSASWNLYKDQKKMIKAADNWIDLIKLKKL